MNSTPNTPPRQTRGTNGPSATFSPGLNVNINASKNTTTAGLGAAANPGTGVNRTSPLVLPEPAFYSTADVRSYCEALRAFAMYAAIEVEVGAEILKAALEQAPALPGDNPFQARMRARTVGRKLAKAADALSDAAKDAAAAWAAFQREYSDVAAPRPQRQQRPFQF